MDKHDVREIIVSFSQVVRSSDFKNGVTIRVNGAPARIVAAIPESSHDAVRYRIAGAVGPQDAVTWAYEASGGSIQNADGNQMHSIRPKTVSVN